MIKVVCGGGGKDMQIAEMEADFFTALQSARTDVGAGCWRMFVRQGMWKCRYLPITIEMRFIFMSRIAQFRNAIR